MINTQYPQEGRVVLCYVESEQTWLPLTWDAECACWHFSIMGGTLAANFDPSEIQAWIDEKVSVK